jgi:ubiquinone/menaquinone biosynthesis C-methylase UbiE
LEHVSIQPGAFILDVGCGGGIAIREMAQKASNGKVFGIDYSEGMVRLARKTNIQSVEKRAG